VHPAALQGWGVPEFKETRDTHLFSRRVGELPTQKEGEQYDYRPLLHRWAEARVDVC
jgi:(E)-4-hydroxy-3-methylbut-2-enyl-diphosphate synthase